MLTLIHTALMVIGTSFYADTAVVDSLRVPEVVINAMPWHVSMRNSVRSQTAFTRRHLEVLAPSQARDVLSLVPGVFVRDYGGANALQTVSFRGGSSSQALVLIDGARLSSAQNGAADISVIPMRFVSSVDVSRGGASALYGANALNGVVDMRLALPPDQRVRLSAMGGSFDQWSLSAGLTRRFNGVSLGADVEHLGSMGSFPFATSQFGTVYEINRENNDMRSTRAIIRIESQSDDAATVLVRHFDRGVPGAVVQGNITQARARMQDADIIGLWTVGLNPASWSSWKWTGSARYLDQAYQDPDATIIGSQGIDVRYIQRDVTQSIVRNQHEVLSAKEGTLSLGGRFDISFADIRGNSLQGADGTIHRGSLGTTIDARFSGASADYPSFQAALRSEYFTDIGMVFSPLVGAQMPLNDLFAFRALWSYNVRPPSFNELYYLNYGTKDLRPERSSTLELAVHVQPEDWLEANLTAYAMNTTDQIVSVPVSPIITSAQNVGSARTYGAELALRASAFDERLRVQYSYALMDARDATGRQYLDGTLLPYAPPEVASGLVMWNDRYWFASATASYTSYRYHSTGNVYAAMLNPFTIVGLQGGVRLQTDRSIVDMRLQCDNLFDASYVVVRGFPMPGRTVRLVVTMELGQ